MISAPEALDRLRAGNHRFVSGLEIRNSRSNQTRRSELTAGQAPFAIILGCSDSRVPPEIVFDQGLGDLFVIRVAGNTVAPTLVATVELAAELFGARLVVVLGHTKCAAILVSLKELKLSADDRAPNLRPIVDRIQPSLEGLLATELRHDPNALVWHAVRANIRASTDHLRHESSILKGLIQKEELLVVGAEYSLETGVVDFFEGLPEIGESDSKGPLPKEGRAPKD